jgi:hypothetical protein
VTAQTIAVLVPSLPEQTAADLHQLLGHHIAAPSPAALRERRLGLLIELIAGGTGEVPGTDQYEALRAEREAAGESWPHHTTLGRLYGNWLAAVKAAMRLHFDGGKARVPASYQHTGDHAEYTRDEVVHALERFHHRHGTRPTKWEFGEWRVLERRLARAGGLPEPRIPSFKQARTLFGTYERAIEVASQAVG